MLQNDMICSKWYNLETNAWITSKLGTQHWFVMWNRLRQVFFQKLSGCCNIFEVIPFAANNTALQQLENFCERNLFESIQNAHQALYTKSGSDYCNISKVIPFAANNTILQHFAENHHFLKKKPFWIDSECQISPVYQVWKLLLQHFGSYNICCKYFAAFCSNLIIFVKETFLNQFRMPNHPSVPS